MGNAGSDDARFDLLLALPLPLQQTVVSNLDFCEFVRLFPVCQAWAQHLQSTAAFWHHIDLRVVRRSLDAGIPLDADLLTCYVLRAQGHLESLYLSRVHTAALDEVLQLLLSHGRELQILHVGGDPDIDLVHEMLPALPCLRYLFLQGCNFRQSFWGFRQMIVLCPSLEVVDMNVVPTSQAPMLRWTVEPVAWEKQMAVLRQLYLRGLVSLPSLAALAPRLETLLLSECINEPQLGLSIAHWTHLRELQIAWDMQWPMALPPGLERLCVFFRWQNRNTLPAESQGLLHLPRLVSLHLFACSAGLAFSSDVVRSKSKGLRALSISIDPRAPQGDSVSIAELILHGCSTGQWEELRQLTLRDCDIDDELCRQLAGACPRLQVLDLHDNPRLTMAAIEALVGKDPPSIRTLCLRFIEGRWEGLDDVGSDDEDEAEDEDFWFDQYPENSRLVAWGRERGVSILSNMFSLRQSRSFVS